VNGERVDEVSSGTYLTLDREWRSGDEVRLSLDFSPRVWAGEREAAGKASIYRGPLLLAYDQRLSAVDPDDLPRITGLGLARVDENADRDPRPLLVVGAETEGGSLTLCDFASAGAAGNPYRTWLPFR